MRIRTIKPEFFTHEGLFDAEAETGLPLRLAFIGLWCAADREGKFRWEPRRLALHILPYDQSNFAGILEALNRGGFVERSGCGAFGRIPTFLEHQRPHLREATSSIPDAAFDTLHDPETDKAVQRQCKGSEEAVQGHGPARREGKGREGNGVGKGMDSTSNPAGFDDFWSAYPRKIGKGEALKAWTKHRPPLDRVLATLDWQRTSRDWTKDGGAFIPHPATWLNRAGWEDQQTVLHRADAELAF